MKLNLELIEEYVKEIETLTQRQKNRLMKILIKKCITGEITEKGLLEITREFKKKIK